MYNYYHVPTDFEYVGLHKELAQDRRSTSSPTPTTTTTASSTRSPCPSLTPPPSLVGPRPTRRSACGSQYLQHAGITTTAITCGVDKYNSYRKYGETSQLSQVSKLGILRAGMWYEWANTNRHQYPSRPAPPTGPIAPLPNFAEKFVTNSYQPFAEYQFHPLTSSPSPRA